jgi:hypothetical protein
LDTCDFFIAYSANQSKGKEIPHVILPRLDLGLDCVTVGLN